MNMEVSGFWQEVDKLLVLKHQRRPWLAEMSGISLGRINNWYVRGTLPRVDDAVKIAQALGVTVRQLVTGKEELLLNHLPDEMREVLQNFIDLRQEQRDKLLIVCRAVMALLDQGILSMPVRSYFQWIRRE